MAERAERWSRGYRITSTRDIAWDLVRDAAAEVWAHRTRSVLTLSGIVFGCASVVAMSSLTVWLKTTAFEEIGRTGRGRAFSVLAGSDRWESPRAIDRKRKGLTPGDLDAVRRLPGVERVNGSAGARLLVVAGPRGRRVIAVRGLDAGVIERYHWPVVRGRSLVPLDVVTEATVALVGSERLKDLFGGMNPVGRTLTIEGARFTVVGVFAPVALSLVPADMSFVARSVVVPFTWLQRHYPIIAGGVARIEVSVATDADFAVTMQSVRSTLLVRHGSADFWVYDSFAQTNETLTMAAKLLGGWNVVVYAISAVTLLVGGIGLLGVLLISEIGRASCRERVYVQV
jgi:putative ABC transport system permease protein